MFCPRCGNESNDRARFCARCGSPLGTDAVTEVLGSNASSFDDVATEAAPTARPASPTPRSTSSRPGSTRLPSEPGRFFPGQLFGERYRIVERIGQGGMGEIYRADDLKLAQAVALKFLPESMTHDTDRLSRFLGEVRIARQVSHANVCRVYDVIEHDGMHFLSMEYIPGEDLGSLLRRIGRLPEPKALEIARQVCAGLAAAHDRGILHRDLKPANIMVDGEGMARIADFGLAGLADQLTGLEVRAGTPGYMAPEQIRGESVSVQSDLYALGLVLFEMFTGRKALVGRSVDEMLREQTALPTRTSEELSGIDPAIERAIRRCLQTEPSRRPTSALAVAAALPGGDPVAAALAAGETPSAEMVAALGDAGTLRRRVGAALLAFVVLATIAYAYIADRSKLYGLVDLSKPPLVLEERGREIAKQLGYTDPAVDHTSGWNTDSAYLKWLAKEDSTAHRWDRLREPNPPAMTFWYRESPRWLTASNLIGQVGIDDPPLTVTGMRTVVLTPDGRLRSFEAVPPQRDSTAVDSAKAPDWNVAFRLAQLDPASMRPAIPEWAPTVYADQRRAWTGSYPERPEIPIRIEAAAYRDRIVYFDVIDGWRMPALMHQSPGQSAPRIVQAIIILAFMAIILAGLLIARRNSRLGRVDREGATRFAWVLTIVFALGFILIAHHVPRLQVEWNLIVMSSGLGLFIGGSAYMLYLAVEPYVRRSWPETLIGWNKLLHRRYKDARVARDLLVGLSAGSVFASIGSAQFLITQAMGDPPPVPSELVAATLSSPFNTIGQLAIVAVNALWTPMALLVLIILVKLVVRRQKIAIALVYVVSVALGGATGSGLLPWIVSAVVGAAILTLLLRFGILCLVGFFAATSLLQQFPLTLQFGSWYAWNGVMAAGAILALALFGFRAAISRSTDDWLESD